MGTNQSRAQNIVKYVLELRDRLELVGRFAKKHLEAVQHTQKQQYNKNARIRTFQPGDRVLLLLPSAECKLFVKCCIDSGPPVGQEAKLSGSVSPHHSGPYWPRAQADSWWTGLCPPGASNSLTPVLKL